MKLIYYTNITLWLLCLSGTLLFGQETKPHKLHLLTAKNLYVSGESIDFKCVISPGNPQNNTVLFVDICGEGYKIASSIIKEENMQWNGQISIPDSVQTGIYLLRAYMGSQEGKPLLTSKLVPVINRFGENTRNDAVQKNASYQPITFLDQPAETNTLISAFSNQKDCLANEKITFWIEHSLSTNSGGIALSIHKLNNDFSGKEMLTSEYNPPLFENDTIKIFETQTIRGIVYNETEHHPVENATVFLSVADSIPQIKYAFTDRNGIFKFNINDNLPGESVIIQTTEKIPGIKIKLYPTKLPPIENIPFYIPSQIINSPFAKLAVERAQLHKAYGEKQQKITAIAREQYPFYGIAPYRIYPGKYVDLNDFKEIAWEILPIVKYRISADTVTLKIWNSESKLFYTTPFLMVDGIPVASPASLNVLNSKAIHWIDIQPQNRCYGNLAFDGLINIQTYKGDFSNIELPDHAIKTKLENFQQTNIKKTEQPLFRDILCWQPVLDIEQKMHKIDVTCSYETGKYIAVAQAYDAKGKLYKSVFVFEVKE